MQIAVVGAGIIGLTTAHRLALEGHDVMVIAPAEEPHHASTGNAGTIATYALDPVGTPGVLRDAPNLLLNPDSPLAIHRPSALSLVPWLLRFARQSLPASAQRNRQALAGIALDADTRWRALIAALGLDALLHDRGALYAYDSPQALARGAEAMKARQALGAAVEMLDAPALHALEPALPEGRFAGAALFPGTLWLDDPAAVLTRLAASTRAHRIDARALSLTPKPQGWQIDTDRGPFSAEAVVLAAGAWSAPLLRPLGVKIPLTAERGYHLEFDGIEPLTRPTCPVAKGFYFTPMKGRLRAAGTVELGRIGAAPSPHRWEKLEQGVRSVFPDLPPPSRRWMGLRPSIPDSLPVVGTALPGLICAFGHGHIGLTLAPLTAELVSRALEGEAPQPALSPHRF
ncbi:FAD-binding oxidoreductase [Cereibacter sphaeroides]|nr:FAD-binding oxidoreductase [Cereibacter sphaeroides]